MTEPRFSFRRGEIVEVEFLDHAEDGDQPERFTVWGRVAKAGIKHVVIESWGYTHPEPDDNDENTKRWTIVRAAIQAAWTLKRK